MDSLPPARFWQREADGRLRCELCPRACKLADGQRAFCFVRQNIGGTMVLTTYGRSTGFCVDPIEKKPLNHFFPGTPVLSFGTAGCNLGCRFCQNWNISKARSVELLSSVATPERIAETAALLGCRSVAYTYNDPVIFAEYAIDTARACRERDVKNVAVTAGYISPAARAEFFAPIDAANIDLKAFTDDFYRRLCFGTLQPVLDTLLYLRRETEIWFEITTLLIPGQNDGEDDVAALCDWIAEALGEEIPLHLTAFHPDFKMNKLPRTPGATLSRARNRARRAGLKHVYTGNVHDPTGQSTYCAGCGDRLIERDGYRLDDWRLDHEGCCQRCGKTLAGRFASTPGAWGARRQPVEL